MRNRSFNWLVLATMALQGSGLVHALHLTTEHALSNDEGCQAAPCSHGHLHAGSTDRPGQAHGLALDRPDGRRWRGHFHDPATCTICQTLMHTKAMAVAPHIGPAFGLAPLPAVPSVKTLLLGQASTTRGGPRAPPASA